MILLIMLCSLLQDKKKIMGKTNNFQKGILTIRRMQIDYKIQFCLTKGLSLQMTQLWLKQICKAELRQLQFKVILRK